MRYKQFLFPDKGGQSNLLGHMNSSLCDRDDQLRLLFDAYDRCCCRNSRRQPSTSIKPVVVQISGASGAGKTALALQLKNRVAEDGGYFVEGKLNALSSKLSTTKELYTPFIEAFSDLCCQIMASGKERVSSFKKDLEAALGKVELGVLNDAIPPLRKILGEETTKELGLSGRLLTRGLHVEDRCRLIVRSFVVAAASNWPLVILLDDMQWANLTSTKLFACLATIRTPCRLLLICTYGNDEPDSLTHFPTKMDELRAANYLEVVDVEATSLNKQAIHTLVSNRLQLPVSKVVPLGDVLHYKTNGNALFASLLLEALLRDQFVVKDKSGRWTWDEGQILQDVDAVSISQLLMKAISKLPKNAQEILKVASCLGSKFSETLLWSAASMNRPELSSSLRLMQELGLVVQLADSTEARFAHNKVQEVAYSLIAEAERASFHLGVGQRLLHWLPTNQQDDFQMLIVHQISGGVHLLDDPEEMVEYAKLHLRAARKTAASSEFLASATLLRAGIRLLGRHPWRDHYSISLSLHNLLAEVEFYNGKLVAVDEVVEEIIQGSRNLNDAFLAHFTRVYSMGSRGEMVAALDEGLLILEKLGEKLPRNPSMIRTWQSSLSCQRMLRLKSDEEVMQLPRMPHAQTKLIAMRLLVLVTSFAFFVREELMPILIARMIDITFKHGMNAMSCVSFALLSMQNALRGEFEIANRFGNIALFVLNEFQAQDFQARVALCVYGGVYPMYHPLRDSLEPLLAGHRSGLVFGDMHDSMNCAMLYAGISIRCGNPLPKVAEEILRFRELCTQYEIKTMLPFFNAMMQVIHNFMGKSNDTFVLTGDFLNEEVALLYLMDKHPVAYTVVLHFKHFLAVYFNDMTKSQEVLQKLPHMNLDRQLVPFALVHHKFLAGFAAARCLRTDLKQKKQVRLILSQLRPYAECSPENYENKVCLIEAEYAASTGNHQDALDKFDHAIELAKAQNMIHEEGLACEAAGYAMRDTGKLQDAEAYFRRARLCFERWGATAKVNQLDTFELTSTQVN